MAIYILRRDISLEPPTNGYALAGDIMVVHMDQGGRAGMVRLTYPPWTKAKGSVTCSTADAYAIGSDEAGLLLGIDSSHERYRYFLKADELDEAFNFRKGAAVTFKYGAGAAYFSAVILYRGEVPAKGSGVRFGLEILSNPTVLKPEELTDGCVDGRRYFTCSPGRGVITSANRIKLNLAEQDQADQFMKARQADLAASSSSSSSSPSQGQEDGGGLLHHAATLTEGGVYRGPRPGMVVYVHDQDDPHKRHRGKVVGVEMRQSGGKLRSLARIEMDDPSSTAVGLQDRNSSYLYVPSEILTYESGVVPTSPTLSDVGPYGMLNMLENDLSAHPPRGQQQILDGIHNLEPNIPKKSTVHRDQKRLLESIQRRTTPGGGGGGSGAGGISRSDSYTGSSTLDMDYTTSDSDWQFPGGSSYGPTEMMYYKKRQEWRKLGLESLVELSSSTGSSLQGVIRWMSKNVDDGYPPMAGVELDHAVVNGNDGTYEGEQKFSCGSRRAIFMPLHQLSPDRRFATAPAEPDEQPESYDRVPVVVLSLDDPIVKQGLEKLKESQVEVPRDMIVHLPDKMHDHGYAVRWRALANSLGFNASDLKSLIHSGDSDSQCLLSVLWNWVERKPATFGRLAQALCNIRCPEVAYNLLIPALKTVTGVDLSGQTPSEKPAPEKQEPPPKALDESPVVLEAQPPTSEIMEGRNHGIQGHYNSCYMDSTLFAMFAHSMAFDGVLHKAKRQSDAAEGVRRLLLENIVNPLRANGYVSSNHIMALRTKFGELGEVKGLTDAEKDPEEFLNLMWQKILKADPFLKLKAPQRDDSTYIYQLFVGLDGKKSVATVQDLVEQSFADSELTLSEVPSVLILQMPRFGREYKPFEKIIPNLTLNITNLLSEGSRLCGICEQPASFACHQCRKEGSDSSAKVSKTSNLYRPDTYVNLCDVCCDRVHLSRRRRDHKPQRIQACRRPLRHEVVADQLETMELFAVICIETSHYVSFVKCNASDDDDVTSQEPRWCFFDSMADRVGEQDGYNIPEVKSLPELVEWVSDPERVENTPAKDIAPAEIRRLLCDPYMCLYQNKNMLMYG